MQKKICSSLLFFVTVVAVYSFHPGFSDDTYIIKMRLNKGDSFVHNINMKMNIVTQGVNMEMNMQVACVFEVIDANADSKALKMTYKKMHISMDMGNTTTIPDSVLNKVNNSVIGKSVILKLSNDNQVTEVIGIDSILKNENSDDVTKQTMQKLFSKEQLNNMFGMEFSMYPKNPVKIGESWNVDTKVSISSIDMKVNIKYTLITVKDGVAIINVDGVIDGEGQMAVGANPLSMDMNGMEEGKLTIALDNGYLQQGEYTMDIKAGIETGGQKVPMSLQAEYDLSGKL